MVGMTSYERTKNILDRKPVDRIGLYEHFWSDTKKMWTAAGSVKPNDNLYDIFDYDMSECWAFKLTADLDFVPQIISETDETVLTRDGNGALLRRHKLHDSTPEHVDFLVKDRAGWEEHIKPLLVPDEKRINFKAYRDEKRKAREENRFFFWSGINVFESMHPVCGHEHMLVGMALDPDWVKDMVDTYSTLTVRLQEILFDKEGLPDGIWYYEDMGFKQRPFMSPAMYDEIIKPGHKKTIDYAKSNNLPVVMHSCGYVDPLIPGMIEAGIDCLQVIEVKAGMDLLSIHKKYGDRISLMGGIDVRKLYTNDKKQIDEELESKIPIVKNGFGYILHSDHSIPGTVDFDTYRYFIEKGLELGTY